MAPRTSAAASSMLSSDSDDDNKNSLKTSSTSTSPATKVLDKDGITYIRCDSTCDFVPPPRDDDNASSTTSAEQVNASLNLNLGLPKTIIDPNNARLRRCIRWLNDWLISWWEVYFFRFWNALPLSLRRSVCFILWGWYLPLHKYFLGRRTAIHPDASVEYHALTTVLWWGRLFPVTVRRMRFMLSNLSVCQNHKNNIDDKQRVIEMIEETDDSILNVPDQQAKHCTVRGAFIHVNDSNNDNDKETNPENQQVIFWLYGGAFLSGCVQGNLGPAEAMARRVRKNIFLPQYRLLPECTFDDMLWDVCLAYRYLVVKRNIPPRNILVTGISSGAGLCTRLMQFMAELQRNEPLEPPCIESLLRPDWMPAGGVLLCPFVDYTEPKGSLDHYQAHDLIVNQSVTEMGFPYFEKVLGSHEQRQRASPVYRSFEGLPPLCVVVSEHEVVYDQTVELVNRARRQNVAVSCALFKYMCHVFCFLSSFIPEGEMAMEFVYEWITEELKPKKE